MNVELTLSERHIISETEFAEVVVWRMPSPLAASHHNFKYRLALVINRICVLRYDNESGKGDHRHLGEKEYRYTFTTPQVLLEDFWNEVDNWRF